ncbi:MAG TPA: GAF domain-containing protein [Gemmatimonadaceae bacterium]|nr:GAF domain-containing protein [Gemmatimonadaceae bacterium]
MTRAFRETAVSEQRGGRQENVREVSNAQPSPVISAFCELLDQSGLHAALAYLNARTRFRFTGVYRCDPPILVNQCLYDRENPSLLECGAIKPLAGTFCSIVIDTRMPFVTENSEADPRLEKYPVRHTVLSYSGVPIRSRGGQVVGVLCHYDLRPRLLSPEELENLESAAPLLLDHLHTSDRIPSPPDIES